LKRAVCTGVVGGRHRGGEGSWSAFAVSTLVLRLGVPPMESDGNVGELGAPVAGVAPRKPKSVVQVFFPDHELMTLSGLDRDAPFAARDQFTRNRAEKNHAPGHQGSASARTRAFDPVHRWPLVLRAQSSCGATSNYGYLSSEARALDPLPEQSSYERWLLLPGSRPAAVLPRSVCCGGGAEITSGGFGAGWANALAQCLSNASGSSESFIIAVTMLIC
jgi:hypothetical protein